MTPKPNNHGNFLDKCDKLAVEYATKKYAPTERESAMRAFRAGWNAFFTPINAEKAWDEATKYAQNLSDYDFHATRLDWIFGYNRADEWRKGRR